MAKCEICKSNVEQTFLEKPIGTIIKKNGKQYLICSQCQKKHSIEEIKEKI